MKEAKTVPTWTITLTVDEGWMQAIGEMTSYREYGEVCEWGDTTGPHESTYYECGECGYHWEDDEWLGEEHNICPDGCDEDEEVDE